MRLLLLAAALNPAFAQNALLLRNATLHTLAGPDIPHGSILIREGKITAVGRDLPAAPDVKVIDLSGAHIYPGLIDSAGGSSREETDTLLEGPELFTLPALTPQRSPTVEPHSDRLQFARANGIVLSLALPNGRGLTGRAALFHLDDSAAFLPSPAGLHLVFPVLTTRFFEYPGGARDPEDPTAVFAGSIPFSQAQRSYGAQLQQLRDLFSDARAYAAAKARGTPRFDARLEALLPVLGRSLPLIVTAVREHEIRAALDFAAAQNVRLILARANEAFKCIPEIARAHAAVILGPTLSLPLDEDDPYDRAFTTPGELSRAGISFAFATFSGAFSRNLPYQAAAAVPYGLPEAEALKAVTINAARIWGIDRSYGTIEEGKIADLMVTNGNPLEATTVVQHVFIEGREVDLRNRQVVLFEKYSGQ